MRSGKKVSLQLFFNLKYKRVGDNSVDIEEEEKKIGESEDSADLKKESKVL